MAERGASPGCGGLQRRDSGKDHQLYHAPFRFCLGIEKLEHERRQTVYAGVSRGDESHGSSLCGKVERQAPPRLLVADRARVLPLALDCAA